MPHPYDVFLALEHGDLGRLRELLAENPTLVHARDEQQVALVLRARYRQNSEAVELLLALGPELDLYAAAALGRRERVAEILEQDFGAAQAFQGDGFTALQLACFFGQPECARLLLERGANIEAVSKNGMELRALHAAAAGRNAAALELLLEHGAEPNSQQHGGWTALHAAVNAGDARLIRALLQRGANPALQNEFGQSALDLAREKKDAALSRLLET